MLPTTRTPSCFLDAASPRARRVRSWRALLAGVLAALAFSAPALAQLDDVPSLPRLRHRGVRYEPARASTAAPPIGLGSSLAAAGDVNGDGTTDLILAAPGLPGEIGGDRAPGRVWLSLDPRGSPSRLPASELVNGRGVVVESGLDVADGLGRFVAAAGDVDGDGFDDVLIGIPPGSHPLAPNGGVFLLRGAARFPALVSLESHRGVVLFAGDRDRGALGLSGAGIGDFNGDGFDDIALGLEPTADPGPRVLIVYGRPDFPSRVSLGDLGRSGRLAIGASDEFEVGSVLASLGDLDGDGFDDLGLGAPSWRQGTGAVCVVWGASSHASDLLLDTNQANDARDVTFLFGQTPGARAGASLAGGLDLGADSGISLVVGAPAAGALAGEVFVIPGGRPLRDAAIVRSLESVSRARIHGSPGFAAGASVAVGPDIDGDERADLVIGAPARNAGEGAAYVVHGGDALSGDLRLTELGPGALTRFEHLGIVAGLGAQVVALGDRDGDGRGDLAFGAPRLAIPGAANGMVGAVYEVWTGEPVLEAPRSLVCERLPGARVLLTWSLASPAEGLVVYRNGSAIARLSADSRHHVDVDPLASAADAVPAVEGPDDGNGVAPLPVSRRVSYVVEAIGLAGAARSASCSLDVVPLPVVDLTCRFEESRNLVRASWRAGDLYDALSLFIDGSFDRSLSPRATSIELRLPVGRHLIEIVSGAPDADFAAEGSACAVEVLDVSLPAVDFVACDVQEGARIVEISWSEEPRYPYWLVARDGVPIARTESSQFSDTDVPLGDHVYTVAGLTDAGDRGEPVACAVTIVDTVPRERLRGRVVWDDSVATPIGKGLVRVFSDAREVARVAVDAGGRFDVGVATRGPFTLEFEAGLVLPTRLDFRPSNSNATADVQPIPDEEDASLVARVRAFARGVTVRRGALLTVPLPVLAVSPTRSDEARWTPLRRELESRTLLFTVAAPGGVARGAIEIAERHEALVAVITSEFGAAPHEIDLVAYGFTGLSARLFLHTASDRAVRRLVLLGTPNLGTPRALIESRGERGRLPVAGGVDSPDANGYGAASEQTEVFLGEFNDRVRTARGADVWLISGLGGSRELDRVLGCLEHDNRVCAESAVAGALFPLNTRVRSRTVPDDHNALGRSAASIRLLVETVGLGAVADPATDDAFEPDALPAGQIAGPPEIQTLPLGKVLTGTLQPGSSGVFKFASDTSDSVVIILNTEGDLGGLEFLFRDPLDRRVTIQNHNEFSIDYFSFNEGEGRGAQIFSLPISSRGEYDITLSNPPENSAVRYSLESRLESPVALTSSVEKSDLDLGEGTLLVATLEGRAALPPAFEPTVTARVGLPSGAFESLILNDLGEDGDRLAGDGIYSVTLAPREEPGYHTTEVLAEGEPASFFERAATVPFLVRSDIAALAPDWATGADDVDSDTLKDVLWAEGAVVPERGGTVVVLGHLTRGAQSVARAGAVVELAEGGNDGGIAGVETDAPFRLHFDGYDIFGAQVDGPYSLAEVEVLDAAIGFVRAALAHDVAQTEAYSWRSFSLAGGLPFVRGDSNGDRIVDISDGVRTLEWLFVNREVDLLCRDAADVDGDGDVQMDDPIDLFGWLFLGGRPPVFPFPECDQDSALGCEYYPYCR